MKTLQLRLLTVALAACTLMAACTEKTDLGLQPAKGFQSQESNVYQASPQLIQNWTQYTYEFSSERYRDMIYLTAHGMTGSIGEVENWTFDWNGQHLERLEYKGVWDNKSYIFNYEGFTYSYTEYVNNDREGVPIHFYWNSKNSGQLISRGYDTDIIYVLYTITFDDNNQIATITDYRHTYTFTWADGNVTSISKDDGTTWQYAYDNHMSSFASIDGLLLVGIMEIPQLPRFLSKNNVASIQSNQDKNDYVYSYKGDYPMSGTHGSTTDYFKYTNTADPAPRLYHVSSNTSGAGYYPLGALVKLDAAYYSYDPSDRFFDSWDNGSTDPIRIITVTGDTTITAYYGPRR